MNFLYWSYIILIINQYHDSQIKTVFTFVICKQTLLNFYHYYIFCSFAELYCILFQNILVFTSSWVTIHSIKSSSQFFFLFNPPQMSLDLSTFAEPCYFLGTHLMTFLTNFRKPTTKNDKYKILEKFIRRIYCFSNKITVVGFRSHVYRCKATVENPTLCV